jgi:serine/threonine-protein kinase
VNLDPLEGGRYQLQEVIGIGGMATVFRAWDERLQVIRAIKVLLPQLAQNTTIRHRFETEARTMARLYHPNIVGVHDVGVDGERVYIIMELVAGGSLMDHVTAHGPMPIKMATKSLLALLFALKSAHSKGVIHRDIKPHNIMVDHEGVLKVGDFGIAHVMDETNSMTKTGSIMGTWGYMAPEQRASARDVDVRSDLYSAAASWYTLLTNQLPSDLFAVDLDDTMFDGVPEAAHEVMKKATRFKAGDRYADCAEMIKAVEALLVALPEDEGEYIVPGSNLDEEALGLGRRGATIVPHSGSSEVSGGRMRMSAPTYAGGVISEKISNSQSGTDTGTLFGSESGEEVETTATVGKKNRLFFGLGMCLALALGAVLFTRGDKVDESLPGLTREELEMEAVIAQLYATDVGEPSAEGAVVAAEGAPTEEGRNGSEIVAIPTQESPAGPTPVEAKEEAEVPELVEKEELPVQVKPPPVPQRLAFMGSVTVRGQGVDELETLYLLSGEDGRRYEQPFIRIPGGSYTLHYRFSGEDGPVLQAASTVEVAAGKTPRIRCSAGFGSCQVQN